MIQVIKKCPWTFEITGEGPRHVFERLSRRGKFYFIYN